ncbi:hypothetical protein OCU04_000327 [Sclerotinia nivalis]|uniref:Berberine/berberine-like domain-containing protein n=1 Tax=Sclerotinia nivalis TaxID=352851 RepID=A0A9X0DNM7_9HELO|nr:hypothetical protein OCU04_000327 [Sclerotinia nivalis]
MKIATLSETSRDIQKMQANRVRQIFATTSFQFSIVHLQNVYALFRSAVASVEDIKGIRWTLTYWRLHSSITNKSAAHEDASDDVCMDRAAKRFIEKVDDSSKNAGLFNRYKYINYSAGYQDPISGYGDEMKSSLQAVRKKYDPEGVFQTVVPGGFKISR